MDEQRKVLIFIQSNCGGAERVSIQIARYLYNSDYIVKLFIVGESDNIINSFIPFFIDHERVIVKNFRDGLNLKLFNIFKEEKPNIIFSSTFPLNTRICFISLFFPNIKVIIRSDNYLSAFSRLQRLRAFLFYRKANILIMQTNEMKNEFKDKLFLNEKKLFMLPNPIDKITIDDKVSNTVSPFNSSFINYVYVGRIKESKGIDILIKSFAKLYIINPLVRLFIIGETAGVFKEYFNLMLELSLSFDLVNIITFVGFSDNPYLYMKYADTLVLTSRIEGLPNVVIESLYLGTPVVVTRSVPVIDRLVNHGVNGYVLNVDDIDGIVTALDKSSLLGRVSSNYESADISDFLNIF